MYCYYAELKNNEVIAITNFEVVEDGVYLFDYMRKGKKYSKNEVVKIIQSRLFMGTKTEKVVFEGEEEKEEATETVVFNYKKSVADAVQTEMDYLMKNKIVPSFDFIDTIDNGNNEYTLRLFKANYNQCAKWIVKEFKTILNTNDKTVTLFLV